MSRILPVLLLALHCAASAQTRAEQQRIDALLAAVEASGCEFERNGSRYEARDGAAHLRMKLERAGERVQTARDFIERVASASSQSGRPYWVLCPGRAPQRSRDWLAERLAGLDNARR